MQFNTARKTAQLIKMIKMSVSKKKPYQKYQVGVKEQRPLLYFNHIVVLDN